MSEKNTELKSKTIRGVAWAMAERVLAQGISFIVSIVLARILLPEEYGIIAIVMVITNICNVFFSVGISTSLIQKKEASGLDFSTGFWFSLLFALGLYVIVYFIAGPVAGFYGYPELKAIIRVMCLALFISALRSVQKAFVSRKMKFRLFFYSTLAGTVVAAVVGILMAVGGFGVWALVAQYLANNLIDSIVLWFTAKWRPRFEFSKKSLREQITFGWKILVASLLYTIYEDLRTLIIGKVYSSDDLAYYNKGKQLPGFLVNNINSAVSSALLPAMSRLQDDVESMRLAIRRFIRTGSYILMPTMFGMAIVARPLVSWLLTDKWLFCVPFLQIMCIHFALQPLQEANTQAVVAVGRSDISLRAEIVKRVFNVVMILLTYRISVTMLAIGEVISSVFSLLVNTWVSRKLFRYGTIEQLKDIFPYVGMSLIMAGGCYGVSLLSLPSGVIVLLEVMAGGAIYILLSILFKVESFVYLKNMLLSKKS